MTGWLNPYAAPEAVSHICNIIFAGGLVFLILMWLIGRGRR